MQWTNYDQDQWWEGGTAVAYAAAANDVEMVNCLADLGANLNDPHPSRPISPLEVALSQRAHAAARQLVLRGATASLVPTDDSYNRGHLRVPVSSRSLAMIQMMLCFAESNEAKVDIQGMLGVPRSGVSGAKKPRQERDALLGWLDRKRRTTTEQRISARLRLTTSHSRPTPFDVGARCDGEDWQTTPTTKMTQSVRIR